MKLGSRLAQTLDMSNLQSSQGSCRTAWWIAQSAEPLLARVPQNCSTYFEKANCLTCNPSPSRSPRSPREGNPRLPASQQLVHDDRPPSTPSNMDQQTPLQN
eukprot:534073-Amphidinium_carterae.1